MTKMFDIELELRAVTATAITADTAETGKALDVLKAGNFAAIINVTALDSTTGDETYSLAIETDSLAAFTDVPVVIGSVVVTATGRYEIPLSQDQIAKLDPNAAAIRINATLAGTTPILSYGVYLAPVG